MSLERTSESVGKSDKQIVFVRFYSQISWKDENKKSNVAALSFNPLLFLPRKVTGQKYRDRASGDGGLLPCTSGLLRAGGDAHLLVPEAPPSVQLPESVRETPAAAGPAVDPLPAGPDPGPVQVREREPQLRFWGKKTDINISVFLEYKVNKIPPGQT